MASTCEASAVHSSIAHVAFKLFSADAQAAYPAVTKLISILLLCTSSLFVIALHYVNNEWKLWRDIKLTLEALFQSVPDISGSINLPIIVDGSD